MIRCSICGGWVPSVAACPNCVAGSAPAPRGWLKSVGLAVGGAAVGMTLAACYGSPCAQHGAEGECLYPVDRVAKDCRERLSAGDPNLVSDPNCASWYHTERCEDMNAAQDPNLAADPNCAEWRAQHDGALTDAENGVLPAKPQVE